MIMGLGCFKACDSEWRFNSRTSNTGPLVRLDVESRADAALGHDHTREILELLARA